MLIGGNLSLGNEPGVTSRNIGETAQNGRSETLASGGHVLVWSPQGQPEGEDGRVSSLKLFPRPVDGESASEGVQIL